MRSLLVSLGVPPAAAGHVAGDVAARYAEPRRRYHTGEHITEVLAEVQRLLDGVGLTGDEAAAVHLAVWFHDVVYDPMIGGGGNEEASAALASSVLTAAGVAHPLVLEVARLIRLTAGHDVDPGDEPGSVLVDADLSILASSPARYDRYARDVRAEYVHVNDRGWRRGRAEVLHRFLDHGALYRIGPDQAGRDEGARVNMKRELAALTVEEAGGEGGPADGGVPPPGGAAPAHEG